MVYFLVLALVILGIFGHGQILMKHHTDKCNTGSVVQCIANSVMNDSIKYVSTLGRDVSIKQILELSYTKTAIVWNRRIGLQ